MFRRGLLTLILALGAAGALPAQDAAKDDEMVFVQRLRERGYADLALNYLETRLAKNPKYATDVPIEIALTRAAQARAEPDSAKRVSLYEQARADLTAFLAKNASHPRASAVRLETARIAGEQGRTQLARAMSLPDGDDNQNAELNRAIQLLDTAAKVIEAVAAELKADKDKNENEFERGLLLVSQGRAYLALSKVDKKLQTKLEDESRKALKAAIPLLEALSDKVKEGDPLRGRALAWWGRALSLDAAQPNVVSKKLAEAQQAAVEAKDALALRLIGYFDMLQTFESEQEPKKDEVVVLMRKGETWLRTYPFFRNTPEGAGVQYILARMYFRTGAEATGMARNEAWARARVLIRDLESTDNEFVALASQIKVDILGAQKAFERPITSLTNFDDLYMRALYEHHQLNKDSKKFDTPEKRKAQQQLIVNTLKSSLERAKSEANQKRPVPDGDLGSAYYLLTGYYLTLEDYAETAKVGEDFIRKFPRQRHANTVAMFTARALSEVIKKGAGEDFDVMTEERERLFDLGRFMVERWPGDKAGQFGSYLVALHLIKKPLEADKAQKPLPDGLNDKTKKLIEGLEESILDERPAAEIARKQNEIFGTLKPAQVETLKARLVEVSGLVGTRKAAVKKREDDALKIAGDVARLHIGMERAKKQRFIESVLFLQEIKSDFPNYILAQYQLALAALQLDGDDAERAKLNRPGVLESENAEREKQQQKALDLVPDDKRGWHLQEVALEVWKQRQADRGKNKPVFKSVAIDALRRIPYTIDVTDPETTTYMLRGKCRLGFLFYAVREYGQMEEISKTLLPELPKLESIPEEERNTFRLQLNSIRLYGAYGKADDLYRAGKYAETVKVLEPVIKDIKEGKYAELADNQQLMSSILGMGLRSNLLINQLAAGREVFKLWTDLERERIKVKLQGDKVKLAEGVKKLEDKADKTDEEKTTLEQQKKQVAALEAQLTEAGLNEAVEGHRVNVLQQTFAVVKRQLDEMRKKKETDKLNQTISAFRALLSDQKGDEAKLSPEMRLLLAQCYLSLNSFPEASKLLEKAPEVNPKDEPAKLSKAKLAQALRLRAMRLQALEETDATARQQKLLEVEKELLKLKVPTEDDMKKGQPGWGALDVNVLKEEILLYIDMKAWGAATNRSNTLLQKLGKQLGAGGAIKDHYFETAYHYAFAFLNSALDPKLDAMKRKNFLERVAKFITNLVANQPSLGGEEHKERFTSFLNALINAPESLGFDAMQSGHLKEFLATPPGQELANSLKKLKGQ